MSETLSWKAKRYISMIDFIARHKIEARLGNLNPDPIIPIDFRDNTAIPRHIAVNTEEHEVYKLLWPSEQVIPVK